MGAKVFIGVWVNDEDFGDICVAPFKGRDTGEAFSRLRIDEITALVDKIDAI